MFRNLKLGPKFVFTLILISIFPLAIISSFTYFYTKARLEQNALGNLQAINDSRQLHINDLIKIRQEQAKELAGTFLLRQLKPQGFNEQDSLALLQRNVESVYQELKAVPISDYTDIDQVSDIDNISVWDIHGNIVANTNRSLIGKKMPFKFLQILYDKGAYFKGFEEDPLTGEKYLTILNGIRNWDTNEYSGVLFLKSNAKALNDITTARRGLGATTETYLIDKDYHMITESRFLNNVVLRLQVVNPATQACFSGTKGLHVYKNYMGKEVFGVQTYLPDQEWCLLTEMDLKEALQPIIVFRNRTFIVFGCLVLFIIIFGLLARSTFIHPIVSLRDASMKVACGDYSVQTDMKSHDELGELAKSFDEMTRFLARTTSQLKEKNKILEQQKEELKRFDELKSEFVNMVSHELRTPMTVIKGSIHQLFDEISGTSSENTRHLMSMAINNIHRLNNLINNLLDLSKIETGKIELNKQLTNIVKLAKEVLFSFKPQAKEKDLTIRSVCVKDNILINIDADKITQVFLNLIGNAMKFVESGFVEVIIEERETLVQCCVADSGKGIAPTDLEKVFNKFQQFGHKPVKEVKGTGLGLSICKGLVEMHGGKIWVESAVGKGTKFFFTLPKGS